MSVPAGKGGRHTPVMQQFFRAKERHPDAILFFRMGDFYEMFYEDAILGAQLLDITLTSRDKTSEGGPIPMAGVPAHAAAGYVARLLEKGRKVAICEQMEDPSKVKGLVPREVVRVVTPGVVLDPDALDARANNWLVAVVADAGQEAHGLAALDLTTAELRACDLPDRASALAEILRLDPRELLVSTGAAALGELAARALPRATVGSAGPVGEDGALADKERFAHLGAQEHARTAADLAEPALRAAGVALAYAQSTQPATPIGVTRLLAYDPSDQLVLDDVAVRNLELVRTLGGERVGSLLHLLDETRTAMGARSLRRRVLAPLCDVRAIRRRHDAVEALVLDARRRRALGDGLARVGDLERLATRAALGVATPRDLGAIRDGLCAVRDLSDGLAAGGRGAIADVLAGLVPEDACADVAAELSRVLCDEPPLATKEAGIVRDGVDARVDELRSLSSSGKDLLLALEERERKRTGIGNLRIKFNNVFGYYIEVTKSNLAAVPSDFRRKQTVATGERFTTPELDDLQTKILNADERLRALESDLFEQLRRGVAREVARLRVLATRLAELDVHAALAEVAHRYGYVRPEIDDSVVVEFAALRHPIVERLAAAGQFVPNDVRLDVDGERLLVITGPNMSGKSTAMRQVALAVIVAQAGGFVPADRARIGVVDRVFTRVGASDDLARGQSTFMVEMRETAAILRGATRRSLVVLDEIGRGTSTYDGVAIAWAVAEHLHDVIGCRAMFATHYHELCELAGTAPHVANYNVAAREHGGEVVFLHELVRGGANRSYGVAVARLAGVPEIVLARARAILADLERGAPLPSGAPAHARPRDLAGRPQLDLFAPAPPVPSQVEETLRHLDLDHLTPLEALLTLSRLKQLL